MSLLEDRFRQLARVSIAMVSRRQVLRAAIGGAAAGAITGWQSPPAQGRPGQSAALRPGPPALPDDAVYPLKVRASGQTLGEVLAAVGDLGPLKLRAAPAIRLERVAIDLPCGTSAQLMEGLRTLLAYRWRRARDERGRAIYVLEAPASTLRLEAELRRRPYVLGRERLREEAAADLAKCLASPQPEHEEVNFAWGKELLAGFPVETIESLLQRDYLLLSPENLSPVQRHALSEFVLWTQVYRDPQVKRESLPREMSPLPSIIVRARRSREAIVLPLHVVGVGRMTGVMRAAELALPLGQDPYEAARGRSLPQRTGSDEGPAVDVTVPQEWEQAVPLLGEVTGQAVFSDWYSMSAWAAGVTSLGARRYRTGGWKSFLDELCTAWFKLWWTEGDNLYLRDRAWYACKTQEPPANTRQALERDVRAGRLRRATLDGLARLSRPQQLLLLDQVVKGAYANNERPLAEFLQVYAAGDLSKREAVLGPGLRIRDLGRRQMDALLALAPDSELLRQARTDPSEWRLQVRQVVSSQGAQLPATVAPLLLYISSAGRGSSPLDVRLLVPKDDPTPPLICERLPSAATQRRPRSRSSAAAHAWSPGPSGGTGSAR